MNTFKDTPDTRCTILLVLFGNLNLFENLLCRVHQLPDVRHTYINRGITLKVLKDSCISSEVNYLIVGLFRQVVPFCNFIYHIIPSFWGHSLHRLLFPVLLVSFHSGHISSRDLHPLHFHQG